MINQRLIAVFGKGRVEVVDFQAFYSKISCEVNHLGQFFVLHANRLWREARQKLEETVQLAEQTRATHDQVQAILAEVEALRAATAEAAETCPPATDAEANGDPTDQTTTRPKKGRKHARRKRQPSR